MESFSSKLGSYSLGNLSRTTSVLQSKDLKKNERFDLILFVLFLSLESYYLIFAWTDSLIPVITLVNLMILLILNVRQMESNPTHFEFTSLVRITLSKPLLIILVIYGTLIGISNFGIVTPVISLRTIIYPYLVYRVIKKFSRLQLNRVLIFFGYVMFFNALSSIFEISVGVDYLLNNFPSFKYGGSVREIGGDLRTPGLMRSNVHLGLSGAIYALILINSGLHRQTISKFQRSIFLLSALLCVTLATSRSAYIVLILGWYMYKSNGLGAKLLGKVIAPSFIAAVTLLALSPEIRVLHERILVWGDITSLITFIGNGIGSMGSATASRYSSPSSLNYRIGYSQAIFADNYYLSLLYQFGWLMGFILISILLLLSIHLIRKANNELKSFLKGIVSAYCIVAFFLDIGEYYFASILICIGFVALTNTKKLSEI